MQRAAGVAASTIKADRDRYVAFAFTAADVLLELDAGTRTITFAAGALSAILGATAEEATGRPVLDFVTPASRPAVAGILHAIAAGERIEPSLIRLRGPMGSIRMLAFGYRLPEMHDRLFLSLRVAPKSMAGLSGGPAKGLMDEVTFTAAVASAAGTGDLMTLVEIENLADIVAGLDAERRAELDEAIISTLMANSLGGDTAADFGNGRYALLHDRDLASSEIEVGVAECATATSGIETRVRSSTVDMGWEGLSEADAAKALVYSIQRFARGAEGEMTLRGLHQGLRGELQATARRMQATRDIIDENGFVISYQPIVDLRSGQTVHYEALLRFPEDSAISVPPYEFIRFAEEVGMIADFDLAMTRRVMQILAAGAADGRDRAIAINISGQSIDQPDFREWLLSISDRNADHAHRLLFEITESMALRDLEAANAFLRQLRRRGHKVCLDDFGTGASAFEYLRSLDVDIVKIDGSYIRNAMDTAKGGDFVRAITSLCGALGVKTVAEMVETQEVVQPLVSWGISYGQGYLFGKPSTDIESFEGGRTGEIINLRRKGAVETWQ